ncbi:hypothetical protein WL48_26605 [Burkholderia ubonensis]|uniref:hypothetical protein n=1 Tax=Burkholderia ubonensis TaxID=101571 RepID=UPI000759A6CE|nr:hypothetical protein [Burkholderia ubonensis]KWC28219.1 hypothetical protein WL48_26605 [Burkholderia ubonensis]KWC34929.1 hypothetical protein WL49_22365 [Burkholderia ubonensis]
MNFYKLKEAAAAIAVELHPASAADNTNDPRADVERCYLAALQHAVCENEIVYRNPGSRLPIRQEGIAASMTSHWCVVSVADLNAWLQAKGVGIEIGASDEITTCVDGNATQAQVATVAEVTCLASRQKPTSKQLAQTLGPYLKEEREDKEKWLMDFLADTRGRPRLERYRELAQSGRRNMAFWEVGGVVLLLIESGELTRDQAHRALAEHYPEHQHVLGDIASEYRPRRAKWFPDPE